MTGVVKSTVIFIANEVSQAKLRKLMDQVCFKSLSQKPTWFWKMMGEMNSEWQFPFAFSAIDGSRKYMKWPLGGPKAMKQYHKFEKFYSTILLALVDPRYRFIWDSVKAPGNKDDSTLFQSINLWEKITAGWFVPGSVLEVEGQANPSLTTCIQPLITWINPYVRCNNKWAKTLLKLLVKISTEGAFEKLKGRWKVLSKRYENSQKTLKRFGFAYIVLHNTCIDMRDIIPWNILLTNDLSSKKYRPRRELRRELQMTDTNQRYLGTNSEEALTA